MTGEGGIGDGIAGERRGYIGAVGMRHEIWWRSVNKRHTVRREMLISEADIDRIAGNSYFFFKYSVDDDDDDDDDEGR